MPNLKSEPHVRQTEFDSLLSVLACFILFSLCGCHQRDHDSSSKSGPTSTTITALVWAPDWPEEMLQIAAEFSKLNPDVHVDVQFMMAIRSKKISSRGSPPATCPIW